MVDYANKYATFACIDLERTILSVAVAKYWEILKMDVRFHELHAAKVSLHFGTPALQVWRHINLRSSCTVTEVPVLSRRGSKALL